MHDPDVISLRQNFYHAYLRCESNKASNAYSLIIKLIIELSNLPTTPS